MASTFFVRQTLAQANQALQQGDLAAAERLLTPLLESSDTDVLALMGLVRLRQNRPDVAAGLFLRAQTIDPTGPLHALHLGRARAALNQIDDAIEAYRTAIKLKPDLAAAYFELAVLQQRSGRLKAAESTYRKLLRLQPGNAQASLMLAMVLMDAARAPDAETILRRVLPEARDAKGQAALRNGLAWAMRRQSRNAEALAEFEAVGRLDPALPFVDIQRAEILQELDRPDEALEIFRQGLAREPLNPHMHQFYNDLLYRLDRREDYLKSYDRAPKSRELLLGKAQFLSHEKRAAEAHDIYREMLVRDPTDAAAATGAARMLSQMGRTREAAQAFDAVLARHGNDPGICNNAAEAAILDGDPQKAMALFRHGLRLSPYDQTSLAGLSVALRLLGDVRDEELNGYDSLVQVFDLEPPEGFSGMEDFNAELNAYLEGLHPGTREYLRQSLRGGTQTSAQLFGAGHELVERIQARISETVERYIAALEPNERHPFLSRRARGFRYAGSWSSRLRDCGYHVNHIHPGGWISSCYYVGVPQAMKDESARQGWIKFGEPSLETQLVNPVRRAVQPAPGRLVLFPSYLWHGTIPFHDAQARTTIAFDVVPTV